MNELDCIRIVGTAFALEKCQVLIHTGKVHSNGIEARVALSMLEFQVSVRTFFFGYNLQCFVEALSKVESKQDQVAKLCNFDEMLAFEAVRVGEERLLLCISYSSPVPDLPRDVLLQMKKPEFGSITKKARGINLRVGFFELDTSLQDLLGAFRGVLQRHALSTKYPYGNL